MNSFLSAIVSSRPNRLTDKKDERYHLDFGRWAMMQGWSNAARGEFVERIIRNEDFYRNFQWKTQEDIDTFLKDQSGQDRNRIMFTMNMIRQLVEQYRGHSLTMDINFRAENISPFAKNRRDEKLAEMLFFTEQANRNTYFKDALQSRLMIGQDAQETTKLFNNAWIDELPLAVNALLAGVSKDNEFDEYVKMAMAEQMAFSGLGVVYDFCYAGKQKFNPILTKDFFWDLNARRYDLQDSEFMGYVEYLSAPQVLESAVMELTEEEKMTIENYDKSMGTSSFFNQGQLRSGMPVVNAFWRDTQSVWYGYVMNEYGYPQFVKINYKEEGEDKPRWTDKDLIDPPKNSRVIKQMRGRKKVRIDIDNIRFCRFVPWQKSKSYVMNEKPGLDIILDYGLLPYQDTMFEDYCNVRYPFKAWAWSYINGYVSSPIDDAINPQRFLNRVMSVTENQINNSGGNGVAYDADMTDLTEAELANNINQNKPLAFNTKGRGIQNIVGKYEAGVGRSTFDMFNLIPVMQGIVNNSTGTNEAMRGQALGQDQLVGVTQALLQQGSVMQAPFYHGLVMIFKQCYQSIANRGRRIYLDNDYQLSNMVGDYNAEVLRLIPTARIEDCRIHVEMSQNPKQLVRAADQLITFYLQIGMLDKTRAANLAGRSTPDQVYQALKDFASDSILLAKAQAQQQTQQAQAVEQAMVQQKVEAAAAVNDERAFELLMANTKSQNKIKEKTSAMATKALFDNMAPQAPAK